MACRIVDCFTECKRVKFLGGDCVGIARKAVLLLLWREVGQYEEMRYRPEVGGARIGGSAIIHSKYWQTLALPWVLADMGVLLCLLR